MDEMNEQNHLPEEQEDSGYTPRPAWQVWAARIGLIAFLVFLVFYYIHIFGGR